MRPSASSSPSAATVRNTKRSSWASWANEARSPVSAPPCQAYTAETRAPAARLHSLEHRIAVQQHAGAAQLLAALLAALTLLVSGCGEKQEASDGAPDEPLMREEDLTVEPQPDANLRWSCRADF